MTAIWNRLPAAQFHLKVEALDRKNGNPIKTVGEREFLKSTPFPGIQNKPAYPYKESGYRNLHNLLHQPKIQYWLKHKQPDPDYPLWCHSTKIMSALIIGLIHYVTYFPDANDADQALKIADRVVESRPLFEGAFRLHIADKESFALSDHLPQLAVFQSN